jgi:hypothetical protein
MTFPSSGNDVLDGVLADLAAESEPLDDLVAPLDEQGWATATPAEGWDIKHQVLAAGAAASGADLLERWRRSRETLREVLATYPAGERLPWFGPPDAAQTVTGPAYEFALLVTQRRHRADTDLVATGADAGRWLEIAQAFAGPPGGGRRPAAQGGAR